MTLRQFRSIRAHYSRCSGRLPRHESDPRGCPACGPRPSAPPVVTVPAGHADVECPRERVPVALPSTTVLARTDDVAVALLHLSVYTTGIALELVVRMRPEVATASNRDQERAALGRRARRRPVPARGSSMRGHGAGNVGGASAGRRGEGHDVVVAAASPRRQAVLPRSAQSADSVPAPCRAGLSWPSPAGAPTPRCRPGHGSSTRPTRSRPFDGLPSRASRGSRRSRLPGTWSASTDLRQPLRPAEQGDPLTVLSPASATAKSTVAESPPGSRRSTAGPDRPTPRAPLDHRPAQLGVAPADHRAGRRGTAAAAECDELVAITC